MKVYANIYVEVLRIAEEERRRLNQEPDLFECKRAELSRHVKELNVWQWEYIDIRQALNGFNALCNQWGMTQVDVCLKIQVPAGLYQKLERAHEKNQFFRTRYGHQLREFMGDSVIWRGPRRKPKKKKK